MILLDVIGAIGVAMLLLAFGLNSFKKIDREGYAYNTLNCIGAYLLAWYAIELRITVFIILQSIWGTLALYGIIKRLLGKV